MLLGQNEQIIETGLAVTGALEEVASIKPSFINDWTCQTGLRLELVDEKIFIPNIIQGMVSVTVLLAHIGSGSEFLWTLARPISTGALFSFLFSSRSSVSPRLFW